MSKPVLRANVAFPYSRLFVVTSRVTGGRQRIPKGGFGSITTSSSSCMESSSSTIVAFVARANIRESRFAHEKLRHSASRGEVLTYSSKEKNFLCEVFSACNDPLCNSLATRCLDNALIFHSLQSSIGLKFSFQLTLMTDLVFNWKIISAVSIGLYLLESSMVM